jgi:hypothetical protein
MIPISLRRRREKVFGPGRAVPLDRNAKVRILAYAKAWGAHHKQPGQHAAPDHPHLPGGSGGAAMGLPQQRGRPLLPELRGNRRESGVRPQPRAGSRHLKQDVLRALQGSLQAANNYVERLKAFPR